MRNQFKCIVGVVFSLCLFGMFSFLPQTYGDNFEMVRTAEPENHGNSSEMIVQDRADEGEGAWTGIDVSIVGKYAARYGRPPRDPYINTDQGDLLLFVFTLAGVIGGFVIGFNVRKIFYEK
ncbi:MAG: hypothetical protein E3K37_17330 [Candidatus Kuenenia sp.]|nr:hypothetical protein [Candidatus Kuenenia hertensis]